MKCGGGSTTGPCTRWKGPMQPCMIGRQTGERALLFAKAHPSNVHAFNFSETCHVSDNE